MDPEILAHYEAGVELERLAGGSSQIEFARTKELLERHLPQVPARVLDVGGGPGAYASWLAERGYEVTLVDPVPIHVSERFASILDGMVNGYLSDPTFRAIVDEDLRVGIHRNPAEKPEYFTTAYFHHPDELTADLVDARLVVDALYGIEGPGWLRSELWEEAGGREAILRVARAVESEPTMIGVSAHLLAVAHRPD